MLRLIMSDVHLMRLALRLARRGYGATSPNPVVGAILARHGKIIGRGWHRRAGEPHAEIEAIRDAQRHGRSVAGATLYVTLEPCSTKGRTPACSDTIIAARIIRVVVGATDPNPEHCGRAFGILKRAGVEVVSGVLESECARLNEPFNHWIVHRLPFVTVKAAMTLDGKIGTASGESKWITGERARAHGMTIRQGVDAILVGVNTIHSDDPSLTIRHRLGQTQQPAKSVRRIILDSLARTPLNAKVVADRHAASTTVVVSSAAPKNRVNALAQKVNVVVAPPAKRNKSQRGRIPLGWLMKRLGVENVTSLLVEGGGEVNASFLSGGLAHRVAFFYAPKILGGRHSRRSVAGDGIARLSEIVNLSDVEWRRLDGDLLLTARIGVNRDARDSPA